MPRLRLLPEVEAAYTPEEAVPILQYLENRGGPIAIDTETTGLNIMRDRVLFWSMATEDRRFFFPADMLSVFESLFQSKTQRWYLANAKYDRHLLANMGHPLCGETWDIIDMDALDDDTRPHGLKDQADYAYGADWGEFKDLFLDTYMVSEVLGLDRGSFTRFKEMSVGDKLLLVYNEQPEIVEDYATCDAFFTYMRTVDLQDRLSCTPLATAVIGGPEFSTLLDYYKVLEVPLTKTLWRMERNGILVDEDYVKKLDGPLRDGITAYQNRVWDAAGRKFNVKSPDELRIILFDQKRGFGLKPLNYTTGSGTPKASTDEPTLVGLLLRLSKDSRAYKFIEALLEYRGLVKLHGTYVRDLIKKYTTNGRVHCRFNQSGARTARLSSANPNMQNIPVNGDNYKIRGAFISDPGYALIDYDYPQIEFRIAAAHAREELMLTDIRRGWDIHTANAANMYKADPDVSYEAIQEARRKKDAKEPLSDVDKKLLGRRVSAKTTGLGALYGEGPMKMSQQLDCSVEEAKETIRRFFDTYRNIDGHIKYMHEYAHNNECTFTMLGRLRRLHRINSDNRALVMAERRQAYNTNIQGSGAEMIKLAMLQIDNNPDFATLGGKLLLTVHDEIVAEGPEDTKQDLAEIMQGLMSDPYNWGPIKFKYPVPVTPDGGVGYRWSELK